MFPVWQVGNDTWRVPFVDLSTYVHLSVQIAANKERSGEFLPVTDGVLAKYSVSEAPAARFTVSVNAILRL